ncbi:MAG TPA: hypothetical protein VGM39_00780 [Kofleriaceae bacterium]|jgi:hypothetical protein
MDAVESPFDPSPGRRFVAYGLIAVAFGMALVPTRLTQSREQRERSSVKRLAGMLATRWAPHHTYTLLRPDSWGHPYQLAYINGYVSVASAGEDGVFFTRDDVSAVRKVRR